MENKQSSIEHNMTFTQNGDIAYKKLNNNLLDIMFKTEYLRNNLSEVSIGKTMKERLFSLFIRDPRYGLGQKNLGRELMRQSALPYMDIIKCGRADDLFFIYENDKIGFKVLCEFIKEQIEEKSEFSELIKKWCPRFPSHNHEYVSKTGLTLINKENKQYYSKDSIKKGNKKKYTEHQLHNMNLAKRIAKEWGFTKQQYSKFIKAESTVEYKLSHFEEDKINFEQVPSLASIKYAHTFSTNDKLSERYIEYISDVKSGKKKLNISTSTVYDIYKNKNVYGFDADMFFDKIEKISGSFLPIIDVSGSMLFSENNALAKAVSIGHYLSICSTYCYRKFVTFSEKPEIVTINGTSYIDDVNTIQRANWGGSTNLESVMNLLNENIKLAIPDYIVILTDMQFNSGSNESIEYLMDKWRSQGINTKIVWWNFECSTPTVPQSDNSGNIFLSGYSPMLLKYLQTGFDSEMFLNKLLEEYKKKISAD